MGVAAVAANNVKPFLRFEFSGIDVHHTTTQSWITIMSPFCSCTDTTNVGDETHDSKS
jgi:hypothetical protein